MEEGDTEEMALPALANEASASQKSCPIARGSGIRIERIDRGSYSVWSLIKKTHIWRIVHMQSIFSPSSIHRRPNRPRASPRTGACRPMKAASSSQPPITVDKTPSLFPSSNARPCSTQRSEINLEEGNTAPLCAARRHPRHSSIGRSTAHGKASSRPPMSEASAARPTSSAECSNHSGWGGRAKTRTAPVLRCITPAAFRPAPQREQEVRRATTSHRASSCP